MREIIFRGKRLDNGQWAQSGNLIHFLDDGVHSLFIPQFNEKCFTPFDEDTGNLLGFTDCVFYKVDPETVGQYTGLKDRNSKRIFEGDIISAVLTGGNYKDYRWPNKRVVFHAGCFTLYDGRHEYIPLASYAPKVAFEVIGNIVDNPELLEEGEK